MNINRNNYEEYFILYMDNELSSDDRHQVELFVKENPDLQEELNLLTQTQLVPDNSFVFAGKEQLLKNSGAISIDTSNYEEWLLSYADNELSAEQKIAVEQFITDHPAAKAELEFLQKTKLQPDSAIIFADKEILYRKEEKVRVIGMPWKRIAVAAALLLAVSTAALIVLNNKTNKQGEIASDKAGEKKSIQNNPTVKQTDTETASTDLKATDGANNKIEKGTIEIINPIAKEEKRIEQKEKNIPYLPIELKKDEQVVADTKEKKKTNDLPEPTYNPYVNKPIDDDATAMVKPSVKEPLTNLKESNSTSIVTHDNPQPLEDMITVANQEPARKNKLRGFFRKVTRTFEKNTNIKATDDEDRLLLGGLAIKL